MISICPIASKEVTFSSKATLSVWGRSNEDTPYHTAGYMLHKLSKGVSWGYQRGCQQSAVVADQVGEDVLGNARGRPELCSRGELATNPPHKGRWHKSSLVSSRPYQGVREYMPETLGSYKSSERVNCAITGHAE